MKNFTRTILGAGLFALAGTAAAVPITGSVGFTGSYEHDGTNLGNATTISNISASIDGTVTGSFASEGINGSSAVTYSDFTFSPAGPVANLWSVGSFSFDLNIMDVKYQDTSSLVLSGTGLIKSTSAGLDDTFGKWTFTANAVQSNFTFSSSAAPEPGIALLLGAGLIGFGASRKLRKS